MIPEGRIINSKYLYNGKELQTDFGLDWYDYGFRFYDPALARFTTIDPQAENYVGWSPYHYVANNPMLLTDPTGMDWYSYTDDDGNEHYKYQDGSDKSIDVDGNTYSNIGSSVSINLNDDVYLNAFQNLTMTSYGEAVDLKGKILNDNGMFHDYIKNGSDLSMQGRQELFENKISQSIGENGLQVMKGIGAITGGVIAGGELIGLAPAIEAIGMNYMTTGEVLNNLKGASIAYRWAATNTSHWLVYTESGSMLQLLGIQCYQKAHEVLFLGFQ
jgi:RHS repeat-associated protein